MNVLVIVTESESANGICCSSVMKELNSRGVSVYCITNHEFNEKKEYIKNGIKYYTVKPRCIYRINSYIRHNKLSRIMRFLLSKLVFVINKAKLLISYFSWPLISPLYSYRIYRLSDKICREKEIEIIIPVYTQIDTLIAAYLIKKKYPEIKYIPYFLDSLSGGYGPKVFSHNWLIRRGLKWERKLLPLADQIIMMESSKEHHEKYSAFETYYERIQYLDLPLFKLRQNICSFQRNRTVTLVYVGSLPSGIRSPEYILNVFQQIDDNNWRFIFVGTDECELLNKYARYDKRITIIGRCDHEQALEYEAQADILVNIGNTNSNMTPSKIFEYMSWLKKIVSTVPIEKEPSIPYLKNYPFALILSEKIDNYKQASMKLVEFAYSSPKTSVSGEELLKTFWKNTPEAFADVIMKGISNANSRN